MTIKQSFAIVFLKKNINTMTKIKTTPALPPGTDPNTISVYFYEYIQKKITELTQQLKGNLDEDARTVLLKQTEEYSLLIKGKKTSDYANISDTEVKQGSIVYFTTGEKGMTQKNHVFIMDSISPTFGGTRLSISFVNSPCAQALLGKKLGEDFSYKNNNEIFTGSVVSILKHSKESFELLLKQNDLPPLTPEKEKVEEVVTVQ